jgi:hypothetical protein
MKRVIVLLVALLLAATPAYAATAKVVRRPTLVSIQRPMTRAERLADYWTHMH